ncbi:MAG: RICIN domain-containing protein, partial [Actinocrinis sp.]
AYINWPLAAAVYPNLPYDMTGLAVAEQPWSGAYTIGKSVWATAHTTQFTQPGWRYLDSASGYLGGNRANGSYVTLHDPSSANWSSVVETLDATAAQSVTYNVSGGLSTGTVHVWASDFASPNQSDYLNHSADITPSGGSFTLTLQPGYVYTLTTTTGQGRGSATGPARAAMALPYSDNFDANALGTEAKYLADQNGSWETVACGGGRSGRCERQMAPSAPISWDTASNPYTLLGDTSWANYTVSSDVLLEHAGAVQLMGRVGEQRGFNVSGIDAYYLQVSDTGAWSIVKNTTAGTLSTLTSGTVAALGTGSWHRLSLAFAGQVITASVDGHAVGTATDSSYGSGQVGYGQNGWFNTQFDNLTVTAGASTTLSGTYELANCNSGQALDVTAGSTADGGLVIQWPYHGGTNQQWLVTAAGGGYYTLADANSGKLLDDPNLTTVEGTQLVQWTANGGGNQQWLIAPADNGCSTLTNRTSGLLADVSGQSTSNGAAVVEWDTNGGANQQWRLIKLS